MSAMGGKRTLARFLMSLTSVSLIQIMVRDRVVCIAPGMAKYRVTVVNEHFSSSEEHEASDVVKAWQTAIGSAVAIAAEQVSHGNPFFGAEVTLEQGNKRIGRYVVSLGATPLKD
jgi:hypothetical protein